MSSYDAGTLQTAAQQIASQYGIPWDLFQAQVNQESGWNPDAVSSAGCIGIAQICDKVNFDPHDPIASLNYMAQRMSNAYSSYGDWGKALASYNCGPNCCGNGNVGDPSCWPAETIAYVNSILGSSGGSYNSGPGTSGGLPSQTSGTQQVKNLPVSHATVVGVAVIGFLILGIVAIALSHKFGAQAA